MDPKKFDELIDGGGTEVPQEETRALYALAHKLTEMADDSELSDKSADRIFAMVNAKIDAQQRTASPARRRISGFAAHLPRPLIQRQADSLAMAIEQLRSGQRPALAGEMALMAGAAASLRPLPAIKPSPSFVDWLEVRLMSTKLEMGTERSPRAWVTNAAANLNAVFQSGRVQAGMAGAAAVIAAIALLSVNPIDDPVRSPAPRTVASPHLDPMPATGEDTPEAPAQVAQTISSPGAKSGLRSGDQRTKSDPNSDQGSGGPGSGGGEPPSPSDNSFASATTGEVNSTVDMILDGVSDNRPR